MEMSVRQREFYNHCKYGTQGIIKGKSIIFNDDEFPAALCNVLGITPKRYNLYKYSQSDSLEKAIS